MNDVPIVFTVIGIMVAVMTCIAFVISYMLLVRAALDTETNIAKIIQYINKRDPLAKIELPKSEVEEKTK